MIDEEVTKILQDAAQKALNLLGDRRIQLQDLSDRLIEEEELDQKEIRNLIGASVHDKDDEFGELETEQPKEVPNLATATAPDESADDLATADPNPQIQRRAKD